MPQGPLEVSQGDVSAQVVPERGALVTSLRVGGVDVLFLDPATLEDPAKNVRGGIPLLFPYAGKLVDERLVHTGTAMKQHGFGRNKAWVVKERGPDFVRLSLAQDADTRAQFPYDYVAEHTVSILPRGLHLELMVHNTGTRALPLSPGWHPYFRCPAAQKAAVRSDLAGFTPDKLGDDREFDFGLEAPARGRARFEVPGLGGLRLSFSPLMRHLQFWSQPGRDFICLEPFHGPANTVNTDWRLDVPPGRAQDLWMRIEL
jgi:galactose mutarotase-like enzyme